jgi:hypothetical protein
LPLELLEDVVRERPVEVGRDGEAAGAQAVGARLGGGRRDRLDLRHGALTAHDKEGLPRLDTAEEGEGVALDVLHADGTHTTIVAGEPGSRRAGIQTENRAAALAWRRVRIGRRCPHGYTVGRSKDSGERREQPVCRVVIQRAENVVVPQEVTDLGSFHG